MTSTDTTPSPSPGTGGTAGAGVVHAGPVWCTVADLLQASESPASALAAGDPGVVQLSHRDRAILRAVAAGQGELTRSCEPDLFLDGRCCSDQAAVHRLTHAGLIATPTLTAHAAGRVPARLTPTGQLLHQHGLQRRST